MFAFLVLHCSGVSSLVSGFVVFYLFAFLIENGVELMSLAVHESSVMNGPALGCEC
jgi:hypothetical protein